MRRPLLAPLVVLGAGLLARHGLATPEPVRAPLATKWGAEPAIHRYVPGDKVGCWSIAVAQLAYHHRLGPRGTTSYRIGRVPVDVTFDPAFRWEQLLPTLRRQPDSPAYRETARYIYYAGAVMGASFDAQAPREYLGNSDLRRQRITQFYGAETRRVRASEDPAALIRLIESELRANRPLLLYIDNRTLTAGHAVVIEGIRWDAGGSPQVLINFGWSGKDDGWYSLWQPIRTSLGIFDGPERWVMAFIPRATPSGPAPPGDRPAAPR